MAEAMLSVNDTFDTRSDAEEALRACAVRNNLNYDMEETAKSLVLACKGAGEFGCEARLAAALRKKDGKFVVKKIKLAHKCPSLPAKYDSADDFVRAEIERAIGYSNIRVGEVVAILANLNIRVGYMCVWRAMRERNRMMGELKENVAEENSKRRKTEKGFELGQALEDFVQEFLVLNPESVTHTRERMLFFSFPEYLKILVPRVEIRTYKRGEGCVVFGVLHDPTSSPVVYACVVSDMPDRTTALSYFIDSIDDGAFLLVDYDLELIKLLEEKEKEYFIKTREICRFYFRKTKSNEMVERVWRKCNGDEPADTPELDVLEKKRYIKQHCKIEMLGLQNTSECDVEFIPLAVFGFSLLDCANAITKLMSENLKMRKKFNVSDRKALFAPNVIHKMEKNMAAADIGDQHTVDLEESTCTCGWFQELLIPCVHACKLIISAGGDPFMYVGNVYSRTRLLELRDVVPVVNLPVKCQSDKHLLRRGPGRPKKIFGREEG
jgi:hypothetical protein